MSQLDKASLLANLETQINAVDTTTKLEDIYALVDALAIATDNVSFFVADSASLPDLSISDIPDGQVVYVKSINLHVVSWRQKWVSLDGRVYRDDSNVNTVWGWGYNAQGRIGDSTIVNKSSPVSVVGGFTDWCQVSAGGSHSLGVRTNGTAWAWGYNGVGALGDGTTITKSSPVSVVGGFTDWYQVSAGNGFNNAIRTDGTAWAWGFNDSGQLGNNSSLVNISSPVSVVGGFTDWCHISSLCKTIIAIRTNGTLWSWGYNGSGRLGDNTTVNKSSPVSVVGGFTDWCQGSAGGTHSAAIRTNGTIWAWGVNIDGQIGDNTSNNKSSPVSVVGGFTDWCQVSSGGNHTSAIRRNGTIWSWGNNSSGSLGDGTNVPKSSPVSVVGGFTDWCQVSAGQGFSAAVRLNGTIWAWGSNSSGRLGDGTTTSRSSPVSVIGGFTDWCQVSGGGEHTMAIRTT